MKAFPALLLAAALLAPTVHAQETPVAPAPQEPPAATEVPAAPAPAPASTDLTPAKDVPLPKPESGLDLMPARDNNAAPAPLEPALIPETPETIPMPEGRAVEEPKRDKADKKDKKGKEKPQESVNKTAAASLEMSARVRYRQIKTRALSDPAVQAEWDKAEVAHTDFEKREALKRYYTLLSSRMEKLDKSLKKEIDLRHSLILRRLKQNRLDGTEKPDRDLRAASIDLE
jgi:hypothetical protein